MFKVIVSNGVFRFHLVSAAMEAARRGALALFVTGAYPKGRLAGYLIRQFAEKSPRLARLFDRSCEGLPEEKITFAITAAQRTRTRRFSRRLNQPVNHSN